MEMAGSAAPPPARLDKPLCSPVWPAGSGRGLDWGPGNEHSRIRPDQRPKDGGRGTVPGDLSEVL